MDVHSEAHGDSSNRVAALATLHCLTGCAIGEVLGLAIGTALGLGNPATIALAVGLAFVFGYSLTMLPLLRAGLALSVALPLAFASDSFSIALMELVDNGVMLAVPGAMDAGLGDPLFWGALALALAVAFAFAFPLNRHLIARGQGHAVVHAHHGDASTPRPPASTRRLVLLGVVSIAVTLVVATGSAVVVQSQRADGHTGYGPDGPAHEVASPAAAAQAVAGWSAAERREPRTRASRSAARTTLSLGHVTTSASEP